MPIERVQITRGVLVKSAKLRFVGNQGTAIASAKQIYEYMRNGGQWRHMFVDSPRNGEDPIPIVLHRVQSRLQRRLGFAWRCLRRTAEKMGKGQNDEGEYIYDAKEKLVSRNMEPMVKLDPSGDADHIELLWFDRCASKLQAAFVAAITREFSTKMERGGRDG